VYFLSVNASGFLASLFQKKKEKKVEGPWRRASFYRVSLSHYRRIKELAFSVFGG
jgi:hypothetical protein